MRIATWNVNGLRARLDFVLHWLEARRPDVVGFQELKLTDEQFPHDVFEAVGYHALTHGQKSWNGVAVLSRNPAQPVQVGLPGQEDFGARLLTAEVEGVEFTTIYACRPFKESRQYLWRLFGDGPTGEQGIRHALQAIGRFNQQRPQFSIGTQLGCSQKLENVLHLMGETGDRSNADHSRRTLQGVCDSLRTLQFGNAPRSCESLLQGFAQ